MASLLSGLLFYGYFQACRQDSGASEHERHPGKTHLFDQYTQYQ